MPTAQLTAQQELEISNQQLNVIKQAEKNLDEAKKSSALGPQHPLTLEAQRQLDDEQNFKKGKYTYPAAAFVIGAVLTLAVILASGPLAPAVFVAVAMTLFATYMAKKFADWKNDIKFKGGKEFLKDRLAASLPWIASMLLIAFTGLPGLIVLAALILHKLKVTKLLGWVLGKFFSILLPKGLIRSISSGIQSINTKFESYSAFRQSLMVTGILVSVALIPIMLPASLGLFGVSSFSILPAVSGGAIFGVFGSALSALGQLALSGFAAVGPGLAIMFSFFGAALTGGLAVPALIGIGIATGGWALLAGALLYAGYKLYNHMSKPSYNNPTELKMAIDQAITVKNQAPVGTGNPTHTTTPGQTPPPVTPPNAPTSGPVPSTTPVTANPPVPPVTVPSAPVSTPPLVAQAPPVAPVQQPQPVQAQSQPVPAGYMPPPNYPPSSVGYVSQPYYAAQPIPAGGSYGMPTLAPQPMTVSQYQQPLTSPQGWAQPVPQYYQPVQPYDQPQQPSAPPLASVAPPPPFYANAPQSPGASNPAYIGPGSVPPSFAQPLGQQPTQQPTTQTVSTAPLVSPHNP